MISFKPHHIHLMSHDALLAAAFYEKMFGASVTPSKGANGLPRANMMLGDQFILISTVTEQIENTADGPHSMLGIDHFGLGVSDLKAAVNELKTKGAEFIREPTGPIAFLRGPDNVSIELVQVS